VQDKAKLYKVISRYFPIEKYYRSLVNLYRAGQHYFSRSFSAKGQRALVKKILKHCLRQLKESRQREVIYNIIK